MIADPVTTITLTAGTPQSVKFASNYPYYWIDNKTSGNVYARIGGVPSPDSNGTFTIAAGSQLRISGGSFDNDITLLGSGKVQIIASEIASCPFKLGSKGGGNEISGASSYSVDAVEYPLLGLNVYGKSVQDGTPTPDAPVDIVSVGDNGLDIIAKDDTRFNLLSVRNNGNGIITKQPVSAVGKVGETATFTVAAGGTGLTYQWWQDVGNGWIVIDTLAARKATFSIPVAAFRNGYKYRCVVTDSNGNSETSNEVTLYVVSDDCEVKTASIAASALPWCGIPVESGGNYTDSNYNKNLVAAALKVLERNDEGIRADWEKFYRSKHGVEYDNSILDGYGACFCYMYGGKTHICYGDYGTFIRINSDGNYRVTYINNCRKLDTTIYDPPTSITSDIANSLYGDWRYEDGTAATEYITPFPEKPVPQFDDPEVSVDDLVEFILEKGLDINLNEMHQQWITDELVYNADGTGKIVKRTGKIIFDGSDDESWNTQITGTSGKYQFSAELSNIYPIATGNAAPNMYCDRYAVLTPNGTWNLNRGITTVKLSTGSTVIYIYDSAANNDTATFKSMLAANPVTVVYQLATPQEIELTAAEILALKVLQTFDGVTSISNSTNADMSVKYCTNKALSEFALPIFNGLQSQIDELRAAILSLGGNV